MVERKVHVSRSKTKRSPWENNRIRHKGCHKVTHRHCWGSDSVQRYLNEKQRQQQLDLGEHKQY